MYGWYKGHVQNGNDLNDKEKTMKKKHLIIVFMLFATVTTKAQMLAVSTDMLHDALMMPSLGLELVTGERTTIGMHAFGGYHPWGNSSRMIAVQPELRYFFSGRPMSREFVGIGAIGALYNITWKGKVYEGESCGIGLTFGYVLSLTYRLNLDFHAGFGAIYYRQKEYFEGDFYDIDYSRNGNLETNAWGYTLLPTRIGISLSYILK